MNSNIAASNAPPQTITIKVLGEDGLQDLTKKEVKNSRNLTRAKGKKLVWTQVGNQPNPEKDYFTLTKRSTASRGQKFWWTVAIFVGWGIKLYRSRKSRRENRESIEAYVKQQVTLLKNEGITDNETITKWKQAIETATKEKSADTDPGGALTLSVAQKGEDLALSLIERKKYLTEGKEKLRKKGFKEEAIKEWQNRVDEKIKETNGMLTQEVRKVFDDQLSEMIKDKKYHDTRQSLLERLGVNENLIKICLNNNNTVTDYINSGKLIPNKLKQETDEGCRELIILKAIEKRKDHSLPNKDEANVFLEKHLKNLTYLKKPEKSLEEAQTKTEEKYLDYQKETYLDELGIKEFIKKDFKENIGIYKEPTDDEVDILFKSLMNKYYENTTAFEMRIPKSILKKAYDPNKKDYIALFLSRTEANGGKQGIEAIAEAYKEEEKYEPRLENGRRYLMHHLTKKEKNIKEIDSLIRQLLKGHPNEKVNDAGKKLLKAWKASGEGLNTLLDKKIKSLNLKQLLDYNKQLKEKIDQFNSSTKLFEEYKKSVNNLENKTTHWDSMEKPFLEAMNKCETITIQKENLKKLKSIQGKILNNPVVIEEILKGHPSKKVDHAGKELLKAWKAAWKASETPLQDSSSKDDSNFDRLMNFDKQLNEKIDQFNSLKELLKEYKKSVNDPKNNTGWGSMEKPFLKAIDKIMETGQKISEELKLTEKNLFEDCLISPIQKAVKEGKLYKDHDVEMLMDFVRFLNFNLPNDFSSTLKDPENDYFIKYPEEKSKKKESYVESWNRRKKISEGLSKLLLPPNKVTKDNPLLKEAKNKFQKIFEKDAEVMRILTFLNPHVWYKDIFVKDTLSYPETAVEVESLFNEYDSQPEGFMGLPEIDRTKKIAQFVFKDAKTKHENYLSTPNPLGKEDEKEAIEHYQKKYDEIDKLISNANSKGKKSSSTHETSTESKPQIKADPKNLKDTRFKEKTLKNEVSNGDDEEKYNTIDQTISKVDIEESTESKPQIKFKEKTPTDEVSNGDDEEKHNTIVQTITESKPQIKADPKNLKKTSFEGKTLKNRVFNEHDLTKMSFKGATLINVKFKGNNPGKIILKEANFEGATLTNVTFEGSSFVKAMLDGANFEKAKLTNVKFKEASLEEVSFKEAELKNVSFDGVELNKGTFEKAKLDKSVTFKSVELEHCVFLDTEITGETLRSANLTKTILRGDTLQGIKGVDLENIKFKGAYFRDLNLKNLEVDKIELNGVSLLGSTLQNLEKEKLKSMNFKGSVWWSLDLDGCDIKKVNLEGVTLRGKTLQKYNQDKISKINFDGVRFYYLDLKKVNLKGVDLTRVKFDTGSSLSKFYWSVNLEGCTILEKQMKDWIHSPENKDKAKVRTSPTFKWFWS